MPLAQGIDPSVITPITNEPNPSASTPILPTLTTQPPVVPGVTPPSIIPQAPASTPADATISPPEIPQSSPTLTTIPNGPAVAPIPGSNAPVKHFPPIKEMIAELKENGFLGTIVTSSPALVPTGLSTAQQPGTAISPPMSQSVHLANTTPVFQHPSAQQLLQQAQVEPKTSHSYLIWIIVVVVALGALGWMVYSQMRMTDQSAPEAMANLWGSLFGSSYP